VKYPTYHIFILSPLFQFQFEFQTGKKPEKLRESIFFSKLFFLKSIAICVSSFIRPYVPIFFHRCLPRYSGSGKKSIRRNSDKKKRKEKRRDFSRCPFCATRTLTSQARREFSKFVRHRFDSKRKA